MAAFVTETLLLKRLDLKPEAMNPAPQHPEALKP